METKTEAKVKLYPVSGWAWICRNCFMTNTSYEYPSETVECWNCKTKHRVKESAK